MPGPFDFDAKRADLGDDWSFQGLCLRHSNPKSPDLVEAILFRSNYRKWRKLNKGAFHFPFDRRIIWKITDMIKELRG